MPDQVVYDVYYRDKKICGILTEAVTDFESGQIEHIVLGIGINFSTVFPEELSGIAGSLYEEASSNTEGGKIPVSRNRLIAEVINQVLEINEKLESRDFIPEYRKRSFVIGKEILIIPTGCRARKRIYQAEYKPQRWISMKTEVSWSGMPTAHG
jgi:BirA family biotin operon repressor/biotin-[acetyl-CoA-carboxylase] ligase